MTSMDDLLTAQPIEVPQPQVLLNNDNITIMCYYTESMSASLAIDTCLLCDADLCFEVFRKWQCHQLPYTATPLSCRVQQWI